MSERVLLLQVMLKRDAEWCAKEVADLFRAIRRHARRAMHCSRNIAFVIQTDETPEQLVNRLALYLDVSAFEAYWCMTPGNDVVSSNGSLDPLASHIRDFAGIVECRQRREAQNMRNPKRWNSRHWENLESQAPVKVVVKKRRKWKKPTDPDCPNG